jgi:hypothetical protein
MPKPRTKKKKAREIPVIWNFPEELLSGYATNIIVQAGEQELYLSFFEARPPVLLSPEDVKKLESVTAEFIATIIVTPERLAKFIQVLQQQLEAFNKKKAAANPSGTK